MSEPQLKRCPHCGGGSALKQNYSYRQNTYFVFAACTICGAQGKIFNSEQEPAAAEWSNAACMSAAAAWNMRVHDNSKNDLT